MLRNGGHVVFSFSIFKLAPSVDPERPSCYPVGLVHALNQAFMNGYVTCPYSFLFLVLWRGAAKSVEYCPSSCQFSHAPHQNSGKLVISALTPLFTAANKALIPRFSKAYEQVFQPPSREGQ